MSIIKWIHISDIHILSKNHKLPNYNSDIVLSALWKDIENRSEIINPQLSDLDFAFITGDLAFSGDKESNSDEYSQVYDKIILKLCQNTGLSIENIFLVPGNHDINRAMINGEINSIENELNSRDDVSLLFIGDTDGEKKRIKLFNRLNNYNSFFKNKFKHIKVDEKTGNYVYKAKTKNGISVQIIGINSCFLAHGGEEDKYSLLIGEPSTQNIIDQIDDSGLRIILVHHPFKEAKIWYKPFESKNIRNLYSNVDFILSGHVHEPEILSMMSTTGSTIDIVSGSIYENREWQSNSYNYVVFDVNKNSGLVYLRRYEENAATGQEFQRDLRSTGDEKDGKVNIELIKSERTKFRNSTSLKEFVLGQYKVLNSRPLLSELFPSRDSVDSLFPDIYVDPYAVTLRHPTKESINLSVWLENNKENIQNILILGAVGTGKTTSLIAIHHKIASEFLNDASIYFPLYVETRTIDWREINSTEGIFNSIQRYLNLTNELIEQIKLYKDNCIILLDALDEAHYGSKYISKNNNINDLVIPFRHIITARDDFFRKYLDEEIFCSNYHEIIRLESWKFNREVKMFLERYFKRNNKNGSNNYNGFYNFLEENASLYSIEITPLTLTTFLFLWLYDNENLTIVPIKNIATLFNRFLQSWCKRESKYEHCIFKDNLYSVFEEVSWIIFRNKEKNIIDLEAISSEISRKFNRKYELVYNDRAVRSILRIITNIDGKEIVISFVHEALNELLVANRLVNSFKGECVDNKILSMHLGHNINLYARELIQDIPSIEKKQIVKILYKHYLINNRKYMIKNYFKELFTKNKLISNITAVQDNFEIGIACLLFQAFNDA